MSDNNMIITTENDLRPCMLKDVNNDKEIPALLHRIHSESYNGVNETTAVIELEDGEIIDAPICLIRMLDSKRKFSCFVWD